MRRTRWRREKSYCNLWYREHRATESEDGGHLLLGQGGLCSGKHRHRGRGREMGKGERPGLNWREQGANHDLKAHKRPKHVLGWDTSLPPYPSCHFQQVPVSSPHSAASWDSLSQPLLSQAVQNPGEPGCRARQTGSISGTWELGAPAAGWLAGRSTFRWGPSFPRGEVNGLGKCLLRS